MKRLFILLCLAGMSLAGAQSTPVRDPDLSYFAGNWNNEEFVDSQHTIQYAYSLSPDNKWILEMKMFHENHTFRDSFELSLFSKSDRNHGNRIATFYPKNAAIRWGSEFFVTLGYPGVPLNAWGPERNTIYFAAMGTSINTDSTKLEIFKLDISAFMDGEAGPLMKKSATQPLSAINTPNPFNPGTRINYTLPKSDNATITIFDSKGRLVRVLLNGYMKQGLHGISWDGRDNDGMAVATGEYFCSILAGREILVRKMALVR